jgi:hypothetical protein
MDDESYFTVDGSNCYGNDSFHSYEGLEAPEEVKYKFVSKFPAKVMVWIAISAKGISDPLIMKFGNAINAQTYIDECLSKRLTKFLAKYHSDGNYIFWPDLASSLRECDTSGIRAPQHQSCSQKYESSKCASSASY